MGDDVRVAVGRLWQQTNDMNPMPTTSQHFAEFAPVLRTHADFVRLAGSGAAELGGFVDGMAEWGTPQVEVVPLAGATAFSCGRLDAVSHQELREELLAPLRREHAARPLDGVLLSLHGALAAAGCDDVEGALLRDVRAVVGETVPVVATLDLHCHVTQAMVESSDALVLYLTVPHVDMHATGLRGARALHRILVARRAAAVANAEADAAELAEAAHTVTARVHVPLVLPVERASSEATEAQLAAGESSWHRVAVTRALREIEREEWCLAAGLSTTQPWLNVAKHGCNVLVVALGAKHAAAAAAAAEGMAATLWAARDEYLPQPCGLLTASEASRTAYDFAMRGGSDGGGSLVVLGDGADATTSGAPGDATGLLRCLIDEPRRAGAAWPKPVLVPMVSPTGARAACAGGVGERFEAAVGGVLDSRFSSPLHVVGVVERVFDATYTIARGHCRGMMLGHAIGHAVGHNAWCRP